MAVLAASNVAAILLGYPVWNRSDISAFLSDSPIKAAPSVVNAKETGLSILED